MNSQQLKPYITKQTVRLELIDELFDKMLMLNPIGRSEALTDNEQIALREIALDIQELLQLLKTDLLTHEKTVQMLRDTLRRIHEGEL